jgi:cation diffusion facilitator family transporter
VATQSQPVNQKISEARVSVLAAAFLTALKLGVGITSGSLAILAEALNSALDIVASLVTYGAVRYGDRPADETHHYGHGKAENLGAFVQSGIMLVTCAWIAWEGVQRLLIAPVEVQPTIWAFGVMIVSVAVSIARVRSLRRAAAEHGSQALEADALHFYTDIYTGGAVLVGLAAVWVGERLTLPLLARADAGAALLVVLVLVRMTLQLGKHAVDVLLDRAHEMTPHISEIASVVPGVERVHSVRTRRVGAHSFVDMNIDVARSSSFEESHAIASAVEQAVHDVLPRADVVVHVDPVRAADESLIDAIHSIAQRERLAIHHITLHGIRGRIVAHLHIELPPSLLLVDAHNLADEFEQKVMFELSELSEVVSHIEPAGADVEAGADVTPRAKSLIRLVEEIAGEMEPVRDCHDVSVQRVGSEYRVSLHCTFDPHSDLQEVHEVMATLERRLRARAPSLTHVVIHPEPFEAKV